MGREIDVLNEEMIAAGVRAFAGGLRPESNARSLEAANLDEGPSWRRKAAVACRASVEVRPLWPMTEAIEGHGRRPDGGPSSLT